MRPHGLDGAFLDAGLADNPLQGLSLDSNLAPSLAPSRVPVAAVSNPRLRLVCPRLGKRIGRGW